QRACRNGPGGGDGNRGNCPEFHYLMHIVLPFGFWCFAIRRSRKILLWRMTRVTRFTISLPHDIVKQDTQGVAAVKTVNRLKNRNNRSEDENPALGPASRGAAVTSYFVVTGPDRHRGAGATKFFDALRTLPTLQVTSLKQTAPNIAWLVQC